MYQLKKFPKNFLWYAENTKLSGSRQRNAMIDLWLAPNWGLLDFPSEPASFCAIYSCPDRCHYDVYFKTYSIENASCKCFYIHLRDISWCWVICFLEADLSVTILAVLLIWVRWLSGSIEKSSSDARNWPSSLLFGGLLLPEEPILRILTELNQKLRMFHHKKESRVINISNIRSRFEVSQEQLAAGLPFDMNSSFPSENAPRFFLDVLFGNPLEIVKWGRHNYIHMYNYKSNQRHRTNTAFSWWHRILTTNRH